MLLAGELKHCSATSAIVTGQITTQGCRAVDVPRRIQGHSPKRSCSLRPSDEFMQNGFLTGGIQHIYRATAGAAILTPAIRSSAVNVSLFVQSQRCVWRKIGATPGEAVQDGLLAGSIDFENRAAAILGGRAVWTRSSLNSSAIKVALVV